MRKLWVVWLYVPFFACFATAQETHSHGVPLKLGKVSFPISCSAGVQEQFDRGVALLHSFAYTAAKESFQSVAEIDPKCAMAHWGVAMTYYHPLWTPTLVPGGIAIAQREIEAGKQIGSGSLRERELVAALGLIYQDTDTVSYRTRALAYERAMSDVAAEYPDDVEVQVFYALALLATASPADKTHGNQKKAIAILGPLYQTHPEHPGIPHYLIHACDNSELAPAGLAAARAYAQIAPSAPHALHMPSHIFTQLGLWDDSIASNLAASEAARQQGDTGEELHAMDYLVYAYLQLGRDKDASVVIDRLKSMSNLQGKDFKITYAATAMPVRYAVERSQWTEAEAVVPMAGAPPQVVAVAVWSRAMGLARTGRITEARVEGEKLRQIEGELRAAGDTYWATQAEILRGEVMAWSTQENKNPQEAAALMRAAADEEDSIEKLPVTPGPVIPAREQLGYLLVEQGQPDLALKEFKLTLTREPGRLGAVKGVALASKLSSEKRTVQ